MTTPTTLLARARATVHSGLRTYGDGTYGDGTYGGGATAATLAAPDLRSLALFAAGRPPAVTVGARPLAVTMAVRSLLVAAVAP